jgi:hypothetical protein
MRRYTKEQFTHTLRELEGGASVESFPVLQRRDESDYGEYRTKRLILEIYDEMAGAMTTGQPYQTRLDPPPQGGFAQRLKRVNAIGRPQDQVELAELVAALGDESGQIRYLAGALLGRLGGLATMNMLSAYLQSKPGEIGREEALKVLRMFGERSEDETINSEVRLQMKQNQKGDS